MGLTEKIDVIDMIINILTEHEKTMDTLVNRMEEIVVASKTFYFTATVRKGGNSKLIYLQKDIWKAANLDIGDVVDIALKKKISSNR